MTALAFAPNGVNKSSLSNIIEEWFTNDLDRKNNLNNPMTNIKELDDSYVIELFVPGLTKESFDIKVERNQLMISTVKTHEESEENDVYKMKQFTKSSFSKTFNLSDDINIEKISASCENGILCIMLPLKDEVKPLPPRTIKVN